MGEKRVEFANWVSNWLRSAMIPVSTRCGSSRIEGSEKRRYCWIHAEEEPDLQVDEAEMALTKAIEAGNMWKLLVEDGVPGRHTVGFESSSRISGCSSLLERLQLWLGISQGLGGLLRKAPGGYYCSLSQGGPVNG
jgi:hypothetical protein